MPFDALTMAAVSDDVRARTVEGRIQKIIQPSQHSVGLSIYAQGRQQWLLLSADARSARVHLVDERLAKAFPAPSAFVMLLRKYLEGARLSAVEQQPYERVLVLHAPRARLIAEVMGKHSNIILIDEDERILGAVKIVPPTESRVRPILPGTPYQPPPTQQRDGVLFPPGPRLDPFRDPAAVAAELSSLPPGTPLRSALQGLLLGTGPFLAEQIALRAGREGRTPIGEVDVESVVRAGSSLYRLYEEREWRPTIFTDSRGRPDFAPYEPLGMQGLQQVATISGAIELAAQGEESRDPLSTIRSALVRDVERRIRAAERRIHSLYSGLEAAEEADEVMQAGQLLLAYQYRIGPRDTVLAIPELEMTIPLEPRLSPQENAEKIFRRYRKLRDAQTRVPALIEEAEGELAQLRETETFIRLAGSESDLRTLERDLRPETSQGAGKKGQARTRSGPPRFTREGVTAVVGRSARENEEVTFRIARREDLWLHARERTGAHVVLLGAGADSPQEVVEAAASLAAYFSEGRTDTAVDVDIAAVRDVRKIPGGPPGRVTYRNFRTVRAKPSAEGWASSR